MNNTMNLPAAQVTNIGNIFDTSFSFPTASHQVLPILHPKYLSYLILLCYYILKFGSNIISSLSEALAFTFTPP